MSNDRGHYGPCLRVGAEAGFSEPSGRSITPWMAGGLGLAIVGLALLGANAASKQRPRPSAHEKEVRAWEAEFPGLPWYMDQVKDSRQLDMWERARDHWEKKR